MQPKQPKRSGWQVKQSFEPSRLSSLYLTTAYEQLVPQPRRLPQPGQVERTATQSPLQRHSEAHRRSA